jgi:hypothetical protein
MAAGGTEGAAAEAVGAEGAEAAAAAEFIDDNDPRGNMALRDEVNGNRLSFLHSPCPCSCLLRLPPVSAPSLYRPFFPPHQIFSVPF